MTEEPEKKRPTYIKKDGRNYKIMEEDAVQTVAPLATTDRDLLDQVLSKYDLAPMLPIIESLLAEGKPIKGFSEKLDPEYFVAKFLQIALTASRDYDKNRALEGAARIMGCWDHGKQAKQGGVNIQFNMFKPGGADAIDAEYGPVADAPESS